MTANCLNGLNSIIYGYDGLNLKKGRRSKESTMKKTVKPSELSISEREELIRLRAETEYLRTENKAIKKLIALRRKKRLRNSRRKSSNRQKSQRKRASIKISIRSIRNGKINPLFYHK